MQRSKASWGLRMALKNRTRRSRRRMVFWFYLSLGLERRSFAHFLFPAAIVLEAFTAEGTWFRSQQRVVASLDDRAQVQCAVNFDQLSGERQKEILTRYRGGRRFLDAPWVSDERQEASRLRASAAAFRFLHWALPCFAAAYWMAYQWLPDGLLRAALMDSPVIVSGLVAFIVPLPSAIEMWTEPDEAGGPGAMVNAAS